MEFKHIDVEHRIRKRKMLTNEPKASMQKEKLVWFA